MPTAIAMKHAFILIPLLVAACSATKPDASRDNETDPAIADALAGPVMSDMQMSGAASPDALRPGEQPATLPVPLDARLDMAGAPTLGEVAAKARSKTGFAGCPADIAYSAMWSLKLPASLALPKEARLAEAAGSDGAGCALRIVRFAMPRAPASVRGAYEAIATREGFAVTKAGNTLGGTRARDGMAFQLETALSKDGTRVDLVTRSR